jgi:hypothetical protein
MSCAIVPFATEHVFLHHFVQVVGFGCLRLLARFALIEQPGILAGYRTGSWARNWKHSKAMDYSRGLPHLRCYWRRCDPLLPPFFLMKLTSHGFFVGFFKTFVCQQFLRLFPLYLSLAKSGAGLAGGFMAYCSSNNPFFMLDKHKRSLGDSGE